MTTLKSTSLAMMFTAPLCFNGVRGDSADAEVLRPRSGLFRDARRMEAQSARRVGIPLSLHHQLPIVVWSFVPAGADTQDDNA